MIDADKNKFSDGMRILRDCYAGQWWGDDSEWKRRLTAYFEQLRSSDARDVLASLMRAPNADCYPDKFPTSGQLQRLAIDSERERAERSRTQERERSETVNDAAEVDRRKRLPFTPHGQAAYVQEGAGDWEQLARIWECESVREKIHPGSRTPDEVYRQRMKDFWRLWGNKHEKGSAARRADHAASQAARKADGHRDKPGADETATESDRQDGAGDVVVSAGASL